MRTRFLSISCAIGALVCANLSNAETLLVDRVKQERSMDTPNRGMTLFLYPGFPHTFARRAPCGSRTEPHLSLTD